MSQIAAALARSKGKKVEPVPDAAAAVPAIPAPAPLLPDGTLPDATPPAAPKQRPVKLAAIAGGAVVILALGGWLMFRPKAPPPATKQAAPAAAKSKPAPVKAAVPPPRVATPVVTTPPAEPLVPAPIVGFSPKLEEQLRKLTITARRTGSEQRIVSGGKVYTPGDTVIAGAILEAVLPDRIVFRDAENHRFERRF